MRLLHRGGRYVAALDLGFCKFGDALCFAMAPAMASLTSITHLDLSDNYIGGAGIKIIASGLKNMTSLTHLDLSRNEFGTNGFLDVVSAMKVLNSLTYLELAANKIQKLGCLALVAALDSLQGLQHLGLNYNNFGDAGVSALISALPTLTNLSELNLMGTGFKKIAFKALKSVLPALVSLKQLTLDYCHAGFPELTTIMFALESFGHLEIHAEGNIFQNAGHSYSMTASLMSSTSLFSLVLNSVELNDDRCRALAPTFAAPKSLKELTLRNVCNDSDVEYRELTNMLATSKTLKKLSLIQNTMLDLAALLAVSKLTSLTHLNLCGNRIDAQGCRTLAIVLAELISLEELDLDHNYIDNEGCRVLAPALASMRSLKSLYLAGNAHDVDSFHIIIVAAQSITSMEVLMMGDHQMSKETCRALMPVVASVQCFWMFGRHGGFQGHGCQVCKHEFDHQANLEKKSSSE
jgi:Ran GTPase-activating protein (RanGAP) involved in mRNA processing and transport